MRNFCLFAVLFISGLVGAAPLKLDYIYPAGCGRGDNCQVTVGGSWAGGAIDLGCSDEGIKTEYAGVATVYEPGKRSKKVKGKRARPKKLVARKLPGHALVNLKVDAAAECGLREVYVDYRYEVTNPLKFEISDYKELVEPATNTLSGSSVTLDALPLCLNGRVFGEEPDRYVFEAEKERTMVAFLKSELVAPGGFIPQLRVADVDGSVISNGVTVYYPRSAPVLVFKVPSDGRYSLLIGGDGTQDGYSSVYRILFGELPVITDFSPALAVKGKSVNVRLQGVNLARKRVRLYTGGKDSAMCMRGIAGESLVLPGLSFDLVDESVVSEKEPNNSADAAQTIVAPSVVKGFVDVDERADFYSFELAPGGEVYVDISVPSAALINMPAVNVTDADGKAVPMDVNMPDKLRKVLSSATLSFPCRSEKGGKFTVEIARQADERRKLSYQLRVAPPVPDFDVWMTPVSINIPLNGSCLVNLLVHRKHGYSFPISVAVAFPPLGVLSDGGLIDGDKVEGLVTVWTDAYRYPRRPFYQELVAKSANGEDAVISKPVKLFVHSKEANGVERVRFFEKPPARINYYKTGMCFDINHRSGVVLSKKNRELKLFFRKAKGSVSKDYEYVVIEPAEGVVIKGHKKSIASDVVRLRLALDGKGGLKPGSKGFLIVGMVKKGEDGALVTASQAVPFSCE